MKIDNSKPYYSEIDVVRCFGMILVVLGHSFPDASASAGIQNLFWKYIFDVIYSFHMPLFFALSGFVSSKFLRTNSERVSHIKKRVLRLLVPYFVWAIVYIPFKLILSKYTSAAIEISSLWKIIIGKNPYSGLWFLYALFLNDTIRAIAVNSKKRHHLLLFISFVMLIIAKYIIIVEPIRWVFAYLFFYLIGCEIKLYYDIFTSIIKNKIIIVLSIIGILILVYFVDFESVFHGVTSILTAIMGIIVMFGIGIAQENNKVAAKIGRYGMDIYILSGVILVFLRISLFNILHLPYGIYVFVSTIIAFFLPIVISKYFIRKVGLLNFLLLGNYNTIKQKSDNAQ